MAKPIETSAQRNGGSKEKTVFISYSHKDKKFANRLDKSLRSHGFKTWIDDHTGTGSSITGVISDQIEQADRVFLCASRNSLNDSPWVEKEIKLCLDRERSERRTILSLLDLDGFVRSKKWESDFRCYLSDRVITRFDTAMMQPSAFEKALKPVLNSIHIPPKHSPLIHGIWSYLVDNFTNCRILVGAFQITSKGHGLTVPEGLVCNVSREKPGRANQWGIWKSDLVSYDGEEFGIFFDSQLVNQQQEPYGAWAEGAWRLKQMDLTSFSGRAYHIIEGLRSSRISVSLNRLDVPLHTGPELGKWLKWAYQHLYELRVKDLRQRNEKLRAKDRVSTRVRDRRAKSGAKQSRR